jgi:hypothetical protein
VDEAKQVEATTEEEEEEDSKARNRAIKPQSNLRRSFFHTELEEINKQVTYDTVKDYIVQCVQTTYKNEQEIAVSLRDQTIKDLSSLLPVRGESISPDAAKKTNEQAGMDILYQAELEQYLDRKDTLEQNLTKAYALIYSTYCNKTMQNRVEEHPDFKDTIRDDPIELLTKIKILMHDPIRSKYLFASLTDALIRLMNIKQLEHEGLLDYVKRFKQFRDITRSHVGTDILDTFVENTSDYHEERDVDEQKKMKAAAFDMWMAYLLIRNSDQGKYGSLMNGLVSQFSMENNQYPKSITAATDILGNHRHDNWRSGNTYQKKRWTPEKKDEDEASSKSKEKSGETSFQEGGKDKTCYCCGKKGHWSPDCSEKNTRPREEWAI